MEHAMSKQPSASTTRSASVDRDDVIHVLGEIDEDMLIDILALNPTFDDLEQAAIWAAGEGDVLARQGHPLTGVVSDIVDILTADEEEPPRWG
jgi:hypothetical protein